MAVTNDILRTWRGPRAVMHDLLAMGVREDRALAILMGACFLMFLSQLPLLARLAALSDEAAAAGSVVPVLDRNQLFGTAFVAWMMIAPLALYSVALIAHLVLRTLRLPSDGFSARLSLFWSLLAATPMALLLGLVQGLMGPGAETRLVGAVWIGVLAYFWVQTMREALLRAKAGT